MPQDQTVLLADARIATFPPRSTSSPSSIRHRASPRFLLGESARQISGSAAWLAQLPSGAVVGINDYRLAGDTAGLADLHLQRGYLHGRWTHGQVRIGVRPAAVGGHAGDFHYAVVEHWNVPVHQQTVRGSEGVFTTPTVMGGAGLSATVVGKLDMVWCNGVLCIAGKLDLCVGGAAASLLIRQCQPTLGVACQGGSLFGGSTYRLIPAVTESGMLRCVILYCVRFDSGALYQGVGMFEAHTHFGTQNMYTKND
ncbi:hypothetical protein [Ralstonia soli]|uniref:Dirigent protein n=1 Tax=Ralstonia soli TaxID=2953896 RepID=A0ABT1AMC1_9RALS|nr:hypothetical protein [Ralstonia soli]MCO5399424.1 hypothetical protein [Ralstonia soli]